MASENSVRYMWILEVRPGYEEEYKKRHDEIWPELTAELKRAGIRNYSIFRLGLKLLGYFECDNLPAAQQYLAASEVNRKWGAYMSPIMKIEVDPATNFPFLLPLQWSME